ncbi:hypothetical protein ELH43_40820 [Rhizobium ruizarguesonis]|uniref:hypothetical protein n=1 Tax=Rhizobium ruizarguesonis TaxID=2081791 RepID=UPI00103260E2|nr:hypothetical protein [Rhizobium ruizarguesonis]TBB57306.1 hypothetical protein ELH43_40820 [Rhizobium ruizarguesonis]
MGHSPSIAQLSAKQTAFNDYLKTLESQLHQKAAGTEKALQDLITNTYKTDGRHHQVYIKGQKTEFMLSSDWSMDNVKKIIDAIGKAMFGNSKDMPNGINMEAETEKMGAAIKGMANLELYMTSKVFDVLSGAIQSFGSSSSLTYNTELKTEPLGNGFRLFAAISADSFKSTEFFNSDSISEYMYTFEVQFSEQEASLQASIEIAKLYEDQITAFVQKSEDLLSQLENDRLNPVQYRSLADVYQKMIEGARAKLKALETSPQSHAVISM